MTKSMWLTRALAAGLALSLSVPVFAQAKASKKQAQAERLAQAETVTKPKEARSPKQLETVTVVGSRIARKDVEGPSPVTIISGKDIKDEGFTTVYEKMNSLTQSFPVQTPPSWGSTNVNARQFNLYGLGANHSLLLIDGMRVADYPQPTQCCFGAQYTFQNYNNIPAGMVDRIEILDSGGSAIYGSDAISGVVNIVLKHHYNGDNVIARGGAATRGGRDYSDFEWFGGKGGDTWDVVYNFQAQQRSALWGYQRPYTDSDSDAGYGTWSSTARTYGYQSIAGLQLAGQNGLITPPAGACSAFGREFRTQNNGSGQYYCAQNAVYENWVLTPGRKDLNGYVRGDLDFANGMEAYTALGVWHTEGISNTELPFLYQSGSYGGPIPGLPDSSGNAYPDPTGPFYDRTTGQVITGYFRQLTAAEMGQKGNTYDSELDWDFKVGLKGKVLDRFDWDLSFGRSVYSVRERYTGLDETAMFNFFFGPNLGPTTVAGTTYNTYALNAARFWGPITPAEYNTFAEYGENRDTSFITQGQATITGNLFNDWAGPVGFAAVAEVADQGFQEYPDAGGLTTSFQDPFQEYNTGGGRRTHGALGAESRIPLLSTLTATLAGRSDRYNEGNGLRSNTWAAGLEWRPLRSLLVRGSYNTSFHAPDMIDVYPQQSVQAVGIYNDPLECIQAKQFNCPATQHNTYFNVYSGANPRLVPETGKGFTYGLAWDPGTAEGFAGSVDYVHIVLSNEIQVLQYSTILTDEAGCLTGLNLDGSPYTTHTPGSAYCQEVIAAVSRDANGNITAIHAGAINEAVTKISAVNAQADYRWLLGDWGHFRLHANYTFNVSYQQQSAATDPLTNMAYQNPKSKINASLTWDRGPWEGTLWGQRIGGVQQPGYDSCVNPDGTTAGSPPCASGTVLFRGHSKPWTTMNISGSYNITDAFKVGAYVTNVLNRVGDIPYYAGGFEFIQTNADQDYVGREWSVELDYKID